MNPNRTMYGRITINGKRTDLGRSEFTNMLIRATQIYQNTKATGGDYLMQIELATNPLLESTTFSHTQVLEQSLAAITITDDDSDSVFPGITIGRVKEVMATPEYERYAMLCDPAKRLGIEDDVIELVKGSYRGMFPDCAEHFPLWNE